MMISLKKTVSVLTLMVSSLLVAQVSKWEEIPENEAAITKLLVEQITNTITTHRDAHPKQHGCVLGVVSEIVDAPEELKKGIFAFKDTKDNKLSAIMRFSHGSSNPNAKDQEAGGHGLALKILLPKEQQIRVPEIAGEKFFLPTMFYKALDIITISGLHEFMVETVADYPEFFKATGLAGRAAAEARAAEKSEEEIAAASFAAMDEHYFHLNGQPGKVRLREAKLIQARGQVFDKDLLGTSYQSWVPYLLDEHAIKYQIRPCQGYEAINFLTEETDDNFLSARLKESLAVGSVCFELAVQKHLEGFPSVEDAAAEWPREQSAYVAIAKIEGSTKLNPELCNRMSFNPGHATPEHRALGGINRSRVLIYAATETKRNEGMLKQDK